MRYGRATHNWYNITMIFIEKETITRRILLLLAIVAFLGSMTAYALAQQDEISSESTTTIGSLAASSTEVVSTTTAPNQQASTTVIGGIEFNKNDLTKPEQPTEKEKLQELLNQRPATELSLFNFFAFWIQKAIAVGIPANTIVLILLIPVFATIITFFRTVVGLPSLEMFVPIVLSFVFVAIGISTSLVVLTAIILAAYVSRKILSSIQLMFFAKRSISLMFLAFFVLAALTMVAVLNPSSINELSIFPLLMLTLMGDSIVAVHMHKSIQETLRVAIVTIVLGLVGYVLATAVPVRDIIILYPETVLLTIVSNYFIGRYFGLRLTEVFRFKSFKAYGSE